MSYDDDDNLYLGTGLGYRDYCGGGEFMYAKGLFKLSYDGILYSLDEIQNAPNKWILSLAQAKDGLMVGTSGSGMYYVKTKK